MRRAALLLVLLAAAFPATASAQPPALPSQTQLALSLERVGGAHRTVLTGDRVRVRGAVGAYVPGQSVTVGFFSGARRVAVKQVQLQPTPQGTGYFLLQYAPSRPGRLIVAAAHPATPALGALSALSPPVDVLPKHVGRGSDRDSVRLLQQRLAGLGYVVGRRGSYDDRTGRAVLAFRKVTGMARTTSASKDVMRKIANGGGGFRIRHPNHGRHIEAFLSHQVIGLIDRGRVLRIYPISSGKPSTPTVLGSFRVYSKRFGTNSEGMVHSSYFIGGYALHGYPSVPNFPASHGCLRVPIPDALSLFRWIRIGTRVDVYR